MYVLDEPRVDYTLARGPLRRRAPLGAGPSWEQFQSAQIPSQLAPRSVLDKLDNTLARGPLRRGAQLGVLGPVGVRPALDILLLTYVSQSNQYRDCKILKTGRKEMFYLTTHSTHFINGYVASDKR